MPPSFVAAVSWREDGRCAISCRCRRRCRRRRKGPGGGGGAW